MAEHHTSVSQISHIVWQAQCSCGWWGTPGTKRDAERQASSHKAQNR